MAVFILNPDIVIRQYESLKDYADIVGYNYKTNPDVGRIIERESDALISISSLNDVGRIKAKNRITYLVQGESREALSMIMDKGVKTFIVDNEIDMQKLLSLEQKINLFLRIKVREHTIYTGKYFVYGIKWDRVNALLRMLNKNENIERLGIHFHRKTQNVGEWSLIDEFGDALDDDAFGIIDSVFVGGGIPVRYANSKPDVESILEQIKSFREFLNERGVMLGIEPGRYIAAPAVKLEANVINAYEETLVLDCSIYNAYMDTFLMHIRLPVEGEQRTGHPYLLKGCSPDSLDIFRYRVFFSEPKNIGDKVVFLNAGAYNFYTEFNNMPRIRTVIKRY